MDEASHDRAIRSEDWAVRDAKEQRPLIAV
jgi:hypothetical protein